MPETLGRGSVVDSRRAGQPVTYGGPIFGRRASPGAAQRAIGRAFARHHVPIGFRRVMG